MTVSIAQLLLSLLEGMGLIASPCILPILPIMLAASLDGGKKRPLGIITGFILAFSCFALLSRQLLTWLHVDTNYVRNGALILLVVFGAIMFSKKLSDLLLGITQKLANFGQGLTVRWDQGTGYWGGVSIGALIGLIWTPCAGPIMAAAIVQIIQSKTSLEAILTVVCFAVGAGIPMLIIALMGRQIAGRLRFLKTHSYTVRRLLGVVIVVAALFIYRGFDVDIIDQTPKTISSQAQVIQMGLDVPIEAPELSNIDHWINGLPQKLSDLKGKVVLIDFWTYSCINCLRTLPFVKLWDETYRDKGLVIIGVHSPEFEFEKSQINVEEATKRFGIKYLVAMDNQFSTWNAFHNKFWPAHYLINQDGKIVYIHSGEGGYDITENNIRVLLKLNQTDKKTSIVDSVMFSGGQTPETYLGTKRTAHFVNNDAMSNLSSKTDFKFPSELKLNQWALEGHWKRSPDYIQSLEGHASIRLHFNARKVFLVLGSSTYKPIHVHININGENSNKNFGVDAPNGNVLVDRESLYDIVNLEKIDDRILNISVDEPGLRAYVFTFGS